MSAPAGDRQIKWFVTVEETDNALREELNHEENWNNSEEIFGLLLTTHVCCSQFIYSPAEREASLWFAIEAQYGPEGRWNGNSLWQSVLALVGRVTIWTGAVVFGCHGSRCSAVSWSAIVFIVYMGGWAEVYVTETCFFARVALRVYSHTNHPAGGEITSGRCGNRPLSRNKRALRPALDK